MYFRDNTQARRLDSAGVWTRLRPEGEDPFRVQKELLSRAARAAGSLRPVKQEFTVRRSPSE
jgi:hypothetical protein